jgi:hypothetical protein
MHIALHCPRVLITDLPEAIELIDKNIRHNSNSDCVDNIVSHDDSSGCDKTINNGSDKEYNSICDDDDSGGDDDDGASILASQVLSWGNIRHCESALRTVSWKNKQHHRPHAHDGDGFDKQENKQEDADDDSQGNDNSSHNDELLIIAADCVYWECLYDAFFQTLRHFTSQGKHVKVIYSHVKRWKKENKFFNMCKKHLHVEVLYEKVEMVPDPVSGQDNEDGNKHEKEECASGNSGNSGSGSNSTDEKNELATATNHNSNNGLSSDIIGIKRHKVPFRLRRQITRVYLMTSKD